jgi:hypothetical protein
MNNILLISENVLKSYSYIGENVQANELRYSILTSQNIEIQETLGTKLYNKILDLVDNNTINQAGNIHYKTLLDKYIQPTLIGFSIYRALDNFIAKFLSIGLVSNSSEQGQKIEFKTYLQLKTNVKDDAEFNNNMMRRYLIFNSNLFPEYTDNQKEQLQPSQNTAFKSPISMPGNWGWFDERNCPYPAWYGHVTNS